MAWRKKRGKKYLVEWKYPAGDPAARSYSRGGFATAAAADEFIRVVENTIAAGANWEPPRVAEEEGNLVKAMHAFLDHIEASHKSAGTVRNYVVALELFRRFVASTTDITTANLSLLSKTQLTRFLAFVNDPTTSERGGRNADTVRKIVERVQLWWAWCADEDDFADVTPRARKLADLREVRAPKTPTKAPTWAEMDACIAALAREIPGQRVQRDIAYLVLMALVERCIGWRVSQVDRLEVRDVDIDAGLLTFRGELGKSQQERAGRIVPIAPVLLPVLGELVRDRSPTARLVPRAQVVSDQKHRLRMAEAWTAAGVPESIWYQRPNHCLRKGFSSELARAGVSVEVRDYLTGHAAGIAGIYTDASALPLKEAVAHVAPLSPEARKAVELALSTTRSRIKIERTQDGPR